TSDGTTFAGPADFFLNGQGAAGPLVLGVNDTPVECLRAPFGFALGGKGVLFPPPPPPIVTSCCPMGLARTLNGTIAYETPGVPNWTFSGLTPFVYDGASDVWRASFRGVNHASMFYTNYLGLACRRFFGAPTWILAESNLGPVVMPPPLYTGGVIAGL